MGGVVVNVRRNGGERRMAEQHADRGSGLFAQVDINPRMSSLPRLPQPGPDLIGGQSRHDLS